VPCYLKGIEWSVVDDFAKSHADIISEILLLWGEDDKTFPTGEAEKMLKQFSLKTELRRIKNSSLMPHEEQPEQVLNYILDFLGRSKR